MYPEMSNTPDRLWTRNDVATHLRVTPRYVDQIRHLLPPPIYVGRMPRWRPQQFDTWEGTVQESSTSRVTT